MIQHLSSTFGVAAANRIDESRYPTRDGAHAALESFYYAFNNRNIAVLADVWADHPLAQLNNPLGGILRGGSAVVELYARIFNGRALVQVEFRDIVEFLGDDHVVFAGCEVGTYSVDGGAPTPLSIRTSRYFRYNGTAKRWQQFHHHGSIDDPAALAAYQDAIRGQSHAVG